MSDVDVDDGDYDDNYKYTFVVVADILHSLYLSKASNHFKT